MAKKSWLLSVLIALSVLLAVAGNLVGNVMADRVPTTWKPYAPLVLVAVTIFAFLVAMLLGNRQGASAERDPRARRSRKRQFATIILISFGELLAAVGGVLSNVASGSLPENLKPYAPWVLFVLTLIVIGIAVLLYLLQRTPPVEATNRRNFLKKLQERYKRRQDDALRGATLIELGLQEEPEAVTHPALSVGTLSGDQGLAIERQVPARTTISEVYDAAGGHLLILGEPGAGKTTLLVELARDLVQRARTDTKRPVPVISNLATWAINHLPLGEWMVEDLVDTYQVPRKQARSWVRTETILPLLDGLDEVDEAKRGDCVAAINAFHEAHPDLPLVVCSRVAEYRAQSVHLALSSAVLVEPLTDEQITAYLASGGPKLATLQDAVESDPELREVLRTPLMLSLVTLTYADLPREGIPPVGDRESWRRQLFEDYVAKMLGRERRLEQTALYLPEETERYLAWLAQRMRTHGLVDLYLERMQPDWLPETRSRRRYRWGVGLSYGLVSGLVLGLDSGLLVGLAGWLSFGPDGLFVGLFVGLFIGLDGLVFGLLAGLSVGQEHSIRPAEAVAWSRRGLGEGLLFGLFIGLAGGLGAGLRSGLGVGLLSGLLFGLVGVLGGGLFFALSTRAVAERDLLTPNEGIRQSARNGVVYGLGGGLVLGLGGGLVVGLVEELTGQTDGLLVGPLVGLLVGVVAGLFGWMAFGGSTVIQHGVMQRQLRRAGVVPPHFVRFLNYAADHILLQKVGGGYRFIHGLLRDYFAGLSVEPSADQRTKANWSPALVNVQATATPQ